MNVAQQLQDLRARDVHLWIEGAMLRYNGPEEALTPQVLADLKASKRKLIARLRIEAASGQAAASAPVAPELQVLEPSPSAVQAEPASTCTSPAPSEEHAARLRLAREIGGILEALPGAKRLRSGDWRFGGEVWEHDKAVLLAAHRRGKTSGGCPLEWETGAAFRQECERLPDPDSPEALPEALVWARNLLGAQADADGVRHVAELTLDARRAVIKNAPPVETAPAPTAPEPQPELAAQPEPPQLGLFEAAPQVLGGFTR